MLADLQEAADRATLSARFLNGTPAPPPVPSADGKAVVVALPLRSHGFSNADAQRLINDVKAMRQEVGTTRPGS